MHNNNYHALIYPKCRVAIVTFLCCECRHDRAQAAVHRISEYQEREKAKVAVRDHLQIHSKQLHKVNESFLAFQAILEMARANKKEGAMW